MFRGVESTIPGLVRMIPGGEHNLGVCVHDPRGGEHNLRGGEPD